MLLRGNDKMMDAVISEEEIKLLDGLDERYQLYKDFLTSTATKLEKTGRELKIDVEKNLDDF